MKIFDVITLIISIVGITIIIWGSLIALIDFLRLECKRFKGIDIYGKSEILRYHLGTYLLLGLEFLIAADIIHTILKPDLQGLAMLASIVAIRTVISYFLTKEIRDSALYNENSHNNEGMSS
ncbi:MAG: DUF1622 domain-containing protein [Deltaproteobacteria bacterium]|nr:DUF1622 domain-containing protein [Deltaproteobacteria bacterium]